MVWTLVAVLAGIVAIGAGLLMTQLIWTRRRLDLFRCKIRLLDGWLPGYASTWPRLPARAVWEHDVLIVYRGVGVVRVEGLAIACARGTVRTMARGEVSRLGRHPVALDLVLDCGPRIELAVPASAQSHLCGPYLVAEAQAERGSKNSR